MKTYSNEFRLVFISGKPALLYRGHQGAPLLRMFSLSSTLSGSSRTRRPEGRGMSQQTRFLSDAPITSDLTPKILASSVRVCVCVCVCVCERERERENGGSAPFSEQSYF